MYRCIWWCKASVDCAVEGPTQGFPSSLQMMSAACGIVVVGRSTYVNAVYGSLQIRQRGLLLRNSLWWLLGVVTGSERNRAARLIVVPCVLLGIPSLTPLLGCWLLLPRPQLNRHLTWNTLGRRSRRIREVRLVGRAARRDRAHWCVHWIGTLNCR
jgi:hypothetical protein